MKDRVSPVEICAAVGVDHQQWVEVMRRIRDEVLENDVEVITRTIGTFYLQQRRKTKRVLNGVTYEIPRREVVALRPPRFPGREVTNSVTVNDIFVDYLRRGSAVGINESAGDSDPTVFTFETNDRFEWTIEVSRVLPSGVYPLNTVEDLKSTVRVTARHIDGHRTFLVQAAGLPDPKRFRMKVQNFDLFEFEIDWRFDEPQEIPVEALINGDIASIRRIPESSIPFVSLYRPLIFDIDGDIM